MADGTATVLIQGLVYVAVLLLLFMGLFVTVYVWPPGSYTYYIINEWIEQNDFANQFTLNVFLS